MVDKKVDAAVCWLTYKYSRLVRSLLQDFCFKQSNVFTKTLNAVTGHGKLKPLLLDAFGQSDFLDCSISKKESQISK